MNVPGATTGNSAPGSLGALNIIGCGKAGRTLARLWAGQAVLTIGGVLNRSMDSAGKAVEFIGAGLAVNSIEQMEPADLYLVGTPDDQLAAACGLLASSGLLSSGGIVFHLSGATRSSVLDAARGAGARAASIHPVKSFADPAVSVRSFTGTYCGAEGDPDAVAALARCFEAIGGRMFAIDPEHKEIYHAASVFSCNYVTALLEVGVQSYMKAGIPRDTAFEIVAPILRETIDHLLAMGTVNALTGPIARGDHGTVSRQVEALAAWDPEFCELYRRLGAVALDLSKRQGTAPQGSLAALAGMLGNDDAAGS